MIAIFIIGFWVVLPMPLMLMDMGNFETLDTTLETPETPDDDNVLFVLGQFLKSAGTLIGVYFKLLVIGIPQIPVVFNFFLGFLKLVSGLVVYLLLREG